MVQIPRHRFEDLAGYIDLTLFNDPAFCPLDNAAREPSRERAALEKESCSTQGARHGQVAVNHVAREDMRRVSVRVSEKEGERDCGPWVAGGAVVGHGQTEADGNGSLVGVGLGEYLDHPNPAIPFPLSNTERHGAKNWNAG